MKCKTHFFLVSCSTTYTSVTHYVLINKTGFRPVSRQQQDRFRNKLCCCLSCRFFAAFMPPFLPPFCSLFAWSISISVKVFLRTACSCQKLQKIEKKIFRIRNKMNQPVIFRNGFPSHDGHPAGGDALHQEVALVAVHEVWGQNRLQGDGEILVVQITLLFSPLIWENFWIFIFIIFEQNWYCLNQTNDLKQDN